MVTSIASAQEDHLSLPDYLQQRWNANRPQELWGSPEASPQFFNAWRQRGLISAVGVLIERSASMGDQNIHPVVKTLMSLVGSSIMISEVDDPIRAFGIRLLSSSYLEEFQRGTPGHSA